MKCEKCDYRSCGDDECDPCDELISTGLCIGCHTHEKCRHCSADIDLKNDTSHVRNGYYEYFCSKECYEIQRLWYPRHSGNNGSN